MSYKLKFPIAFHPVDMAIIRLKDGKMQMLLAQKVKDSAEGNNVWRFPGGFIDPWDSCAEEAALRESMEESGMKFLDGTLSIKADEYFAKKKPLTDKITKLLLEQVYVSAKQDYVGNEDEITSLINQLHEIKMPEELLEAVRKFTYIGSTKIDDYRYKDSDHKVITSFYELTPAKGFDKDGEGPFDDIARTKWFNFSDIKEELMHPSHKVLFKMLFDKYKFKMEVEDLFSDVHEAIKNVKKNTTGIFNDLSDVLKKKQPELEKTINDSVEKAVSKIDKMFEGLFKK